MEAADIDRPGGACVVRQAVSAGLDLERHRGVQVGARRLKNTGRRGSSTPVDRRGHDCGARAARRIDGNFDVILWLQASLHGMRPGSVWAPGPGAPRVLVPESPAPREVLAATERGFRAHGEASFAR